MDNYVGKKLDGRYEILEVLGVGGMAVVYKAFDSVENKTVAVKILKEEYVSNEEFIRRFKNESKAIAVLSHPNIVKVFDVSFGETLQYIVMEYIDGITLKQHIEQQGSLRWKDALHFAVQILRGIQHAHDRGIVHRDVKPQNIMVLADGTIKVTDFGIARFARSEQKTITDKAIGSVHYISPEQARGDNTDEKSDIYSFGVILYEMLTGQLPFQAESAVSVAIMQLQREPDLPTSINGSIPEGLEQITMHAMQKNCEKRYKSASEMLCDLEAFKRDPAVTFDYGYYVDEDPTRYIDDTPEEKSAKKIQWLPIIAGITVACIAALIIIASIWVPGKLFGRTPDVECPHFIGMKMEAVQNSEHAENFELIYEFEPSDSAKGIIIGQSIEAGRLIKKNNRITLIVSSGERTVTVPDVSGKSEDVAKSILEKEGFVPEFVEVSDDSVQKGLIIRTNPASGSSVPVGSVITVYISTGEATAKVKIPDCVGLTKDEAIRLLENKGLVVGNVTEANCTDREFSVGVVMDQSPDYVPGTEVGFGSAIDLVISTGKFDASIDINLPGEAIADISTGYITIWHNDQIIASSTLIDFTQTASYNIDFVSSQRELSGCVFKVTADKLSYVDYLIVDIDCVTGKYTVKSYLT
ncbi:MAG: protein kinase [Clostridia bacterium]|nr:protein kinase [Clostridia bacterium]